MSDFESRKISHLELALRDKNQSEHNLLNSIQLIPEALPSINFKDVSIQTEAFGEKVSAPFFISSMTAGHENAPTLNLALAQLAFEQNIFFAVGSQRGELLRPETLGREWLSLHEQFPQLKLIGNIGATQLTEYSTTSILGLIEKAKVKAFYVHLNALQEVIQMEGTPNFAGVEQKLKELCSASPVPILVKEVGCGMTLATVNRLFALGVKAVDLAGSGGTHWGRIEGDRAPMESVQRNASVVFANWGLSAVETLIEASSQSQAMPGLLMASGGVRSGLDVAKYLSLGAGLVGIAQPFLQAAIQDTKSNKSINHLKVLFNQLSFELQTALFLMNVKSIQELSKARRWQWQK